MAPPPPDQRVDVPQDDAPLPNRPRWGLLDLVLGVVFVVVVSSVVAVIAFAIEFARDPELLEAGADVQPEDLSPLIIVIGAYGQQLAQGLWPVIVSKWRGVGVVKDWGLSFKLRDLWIGTGTAIVATIGASAVGAATAFLVGLEDEADASNTAFVTDMIGTPWLIPLLITVVIGAPLTEELVFRGLVLRVFEKYGGRWVGVALSTVFFTVVHYTGGSFQETAVLFASIGVVGAVLGVVTVLTNRLGAAILAHGLFNLVTVIAILTTQNST